MTQWLVHVSFICVTEVLMTQWLVHVSFISVTDMLVIQWLVHVSFTIFTTSVVRYYFLDNSILVSYIRLLTISDSLIFFLRFITA